MAYHILIIEDDTDINNLMAETLRKAAYNCTQAFSGTEALLQIEKTTFSLIIMDLMLPGIPGEQLLTKIKAQQNVPVIVVSAKDDLDSKIQLLQNGAEDYLTKPFAIEELLARVGVQIRRFNQTDPPMQHQLVYKGLVLYPDSFQAVLQGNELTLTRQEFKILELLLSHPKRVFSKQDIYDYAWEDYYIGEDKTINVHISNIRKKIKALTDEPYIETVWGIGFRLQK